MANYKLADRTHCNYGHEYSVENTYWRKDGGRDCRQCKKERKARAIAKNPEIQREKQRNWKRAERARLVTSAEENDLARDRDKKTSPWNALKLPPWAQPYQDRLNAQLDRYETPCKNKPEDFSDYDQAPSVEKARALCASCPALKACLAYGKVEQKLQRERGVEITGVYGGVAIETLGK